ncbi:MAG TPA: MBL fold metallo-hydrolase [bacterium]|nr:MBL fold metallo-hydrolase [bacterium]
MKGRTIVSVILASLIAIFSGIYSFSQDKNLHIYFLDVGQGDSILIQTPDDVFMLIDGGPGDAVLSELNEILPVWKRNIDVVILTHPDADHVTGLVEVVRYYEVKEADFGKVEHNTNIYEEFLYQVEEKALQVSDLRDEDDFLLGCCVYVDILWPEENQNLERLDPVNNISISIRLTYKDFTAVLAGDAESATEKKIAKIRGLDSDLLKIGHHGSNTSSEPVFLDAVEPEIAIISVGEDNRFGHPTLETLEKLKERNIKTYRTDLDGRIEVISDGLEYWIECKEGCGR